MDPQPSIQRIDYFAPKDVFIKALEQDGCVIVTNFTNPETLALAQKEVQPYLDNNEPGSQVGGNAVPKPSFINHH